MVFVIYLNKISRQETAYYLNCRVYRDSTQKNKLLKKKSSLLFFLFTKIHISYIEYTSINIFKAFTCYTINNFVRTTHGIYQFARQSATLGYVRQMISTKASVETGHVYRPVCVLVSEIEHIYCSTVLKRFSTLCVTT